MMNHEFETNFNDELLILNRLYRIGGLMLCAYLAFLIFYNIDEISAPRNNREFFLWPMTIGLGILFWQGYMLVKCAEFVDKNQILKTILIFGGIFSLIAVFTDNFHSTDLFGYINRGWQQVGYNMNPYAFTVAEIPNWHSDPMITDHWVNNPSPYGFLYMLWVKFMVSLGGGKFLQTVAVFKLFNWLAFAVTGYILYLAIKQFNPTKITSVLYLWLWNPLILLHHLANAHNDLWMGFGVLLAGYLLLKNKDFWLLPVLTMATLTKYGAVILVPFAAVYLLKKREYKLFLVSGALSVGIFIASAWPYMGDTILNAILGGGDQTGIKLAAIQKNVSVSHASLHHLLFSLYKQLAEYVSFFYPYRPLVRSLIKNALLLSFSGLYFGTLYKRFLNSPNIRSCSSFRIQC